MHLVQTRGSPYTQKVPFTLGGSHSELGCSKGTVSLVVLHIWHTAPPHLAPGYPRRCSLKWPAHDSGLKQFKKKTLNECIFKMETHLNQKETQKDNEKRSPPPFLYHIRLTYPLLCGFTLKQITLIATRLMLPATTWLFGSYLKLRSYYSVAALGTRVPTGIQLI